MHPLYVNPSSPVPIYDLPNVTYEDELWHHRCIFKPIFVYDDMIGHQIIEDLHSGWNGSYLV